MRAIINKFVSNIEILANVYVILFIGMVLFKSIVFLPANYGNYTVTIPKYLLDIFWCCLLISVFPTKWM